MYINSLKGPVVRSIFSGSVVTSSELRIAQSQVVSVAIFDQIEDQAVAKGSRKLDGWLEASSQRISASTVAVDKEIAELREKAAEAVAAINLTTQKAVTVERSAEAAVADVDSLRADFDDKFADANAKAKAFMEAVKVRENTRSLKIHWNDRGNSAAWAMWLSAALLIGLLVGAPAVALANSNIVLVFIKGLTEAIAFPVGATPDAATLTVATISRLVIVTIPIALYFWLIRLVVRFNMRSMLLMDDARQRATMLETYYRMIEDQKAETSDRALVLQALMRPPPGHGPDTVEPPNFTEVIEKIKGN